jgi:hypothetical protein
MAASTCASTGADWLPLLLLGPAGGAPPALLRRPLPVPLLL